MDARSPFAHEVFHDGELPGGGGVHHLLLDRLVDFSAEALSRHAAGQHGTAQVHPTHMQQGGAGCERDETQTLCMTACLTRTVFFGATSLLPFFMFAAALCAWRGFAAFAWRPLVFPCTILYNESI